MKLTFDTDTMTWSRNLNRATLAMIDAMRDGLDTRAGNIAKFGFSSEEGARRTNLRWAKAKAVVAAEEPPVKLPLFATPQEAAEWLTANNWSQDHNGKWVKGVQK